MLYLRVLGIFLWLLISCALVLPLCIVRWGDQNLNQKFARVFAWGVLRISGIHVEVEGMEYLTRTQPCVYVGNHQSGLDMATFGAIYPERTLVIGKKELLWIPLFGLFFAAAGNILIQRKNRAHSISGLGIAVEAIRKSRCSVWIFPEGTRNRSGQGLLPFKKGAFYMAIEARVPIVPILSSSLTDLVSWKKGIFKPGTVKIKILPPIVTDSYTIQQTGELAELARQKMLEALRGLVTQIGSHHP